VSPGPAPAVGVTVRRVDSALGRWTHTTWCPPHLADVVEGIWHFEGRVALRRERTFPGGHAEVILHLGPRYAAVTDAGASAGPFPLACVSGVQTAPLVVEAPDAASCVLGLRLRPVGAYALLGCPLPALTDATVDLAALVGRDAEELAARCHALADAPARLALVAGWAAARLARRATARGGTPHPAVAWAAARLEGAHGVASVTRLREATGLGRTRFAEAFRAQVGVAPKRYARVLRFRRALALLHDGAPGLGLPALALAVGYYDHAHLDADFREFAGMTPTAYTRALRYHDAPSLAEPA
jgi:AraC-like DNA-binding protein